MKSYIAQGYGFNSKKQVWTFLSQTESTVHTNSSQELEEKLRDSFPGYTDYKIVFIPVSLKN